MHFYYRTGPRSGVSMPLWLAALAYLFTLGAVLLVGAAVAAVAVAGVLALVLAFAVAWVIGTARRRRRHRVSK